MSDIEAIDAPKAKLDEFLDAIEAEQDEFNPQPLGVAGRGLPPGPMSLPPRTCLATQIVMAEGSEVT
jgi:hypothetical protein